jgi:hypothetical protein
MASRLFAIREFFGYFSSAGMQDESGSGRFSAELEAGRTVE